LKIKTKTRLVLLLISFFTIIIICFSVSIHYFMKQELYKSVDSKLLSIAELSADSPFLLYNSEIPKKLKNIYTNPNIQHSGSVLRILDTSGNVGADFNDLDVKELPIKDKTIKKAMNGYMVFENYKLEKLKYPVRVLTYPVINNGYVLGIIQVGTSLEFVIQSLKKLIIILGISFPLLILITLIFGYYIIDKALAPIRYITAKAKKISAENLDEKIGGYFPDDEIGELAATFDNMIKRLNQSFQELNQFSADVSHELRTPLTVLQGEVEVALRGERDANEYKRILKSNLDEIKRLHRIVETLLFLSKAESGKIVYKIKEIDSLELILKIFSTLKPLADEKNVKIYIDGEPGINIKGDEDLLVQMFYNIVHNAIKYNKKNGEVKISITQDKDFVHFTIEDTGYGIPEAQLKNIFQRFYRTDKARARKEGGFGLGLNIVKKILDIHKAEIKVESELKKGTKFIISFHRNLK
jgi:heavy metal sensor kinase